MSVIRRMRKQTCVYWPLQLSQYDNYGQPIVVGNQSPLELKCRWDDVQEQFIDKDGRTQVSRAIVYPDRVLVLGGVLWEGTLATMAPGGNPYDNEGAFEIRKFSKIPNFRNTEVLYIAHL